MTDHGQIKGLFDNGFLAPSIGDSEIHTTHPQLTIKESDIQTLSRGDQIIIKKRTYDIVQIQPDGSGLAIIILAEGYNV